MYISYFDILDRIDAKPTWWLNGVPRFEPFAPKDTNVYAREAALIETHCQQCGTRFDVGIFQCSAVGDEATLAEGIRNGTLPIGDPPNIDCCASGPTMTSDLERVLEYWRRDTKVSFEWVRDASLEIELTDRS